MNPQIPTSQSYFLLVNKPVGITSQQCISKLKRAIPGIRKIGHHGTLDPFASGGLLVGINDATKFFRFLDDSQKTYEAVLKLGAATDTMDCDGVVIEEKLVPLLDFKMLDLVIEKLIGNHMQMPPMYSAIKIGGEKLYDKARRGESVERELRPITINDAKLISLENDCVTFRVTVSRGTYVRVIGSDLAQQLGTVGHLIGLKRTQVCGLSLDRSLSLEQLDQIEEYQIPLLDLMKHLSVFELSDEEFVRLQHGKILLRDAPEERVNEGDLVVAVYRNQVVGVLSLVQGGWKSERLVDFKFCDFSDNF